ncbi:hypothetical protein Vi05172_g3491 [Venturia inaequalis]|nr:hypothetical protein Vi05172_g3491 [Venturia inaequalis]
MPPTPPNKADAKFNKAQPPTFLTLPRELRQAILYETYNPYADARPFLTFKDGSRSVTCNLYHVDSTGTFLRPCAHVENWVELLSCVHPTFRQDVGFVRQRWVEDFKSPVPSPRHRSMALAGGDYARETSWGEVVMWQDGLRERAKWGWRIVCLRAWWPGSSIWPN